MSNDPTCQRHILLIQRNQEPNWVAWALPGGFVECDETAEAAVVREVEEEIGLCCTVVGLVGFRNRPDPDVNTSYAVFFLWMIGGRLTPGSTAEIIKAGFYTLAQVRTITRLTPLSRELAIAALTNHLYTLHSVTIPSLQGLPACHAFYGAR